MKVNLRYSKCGYVVDYGQYHDRRTKTNRCTTETGIEKKFTQTVQGETIRAHIKRQPQVKGKSERWRGSVPDEDITGAWIRGGIACMNASCEDIAACMNTPCEDITGEWTTSRDGLVCMNAPGSHHR